MSVKEKNLTHVLFVREGYGSVYEKQGKNGMSLLLLHGVPEPLENFADPAFVEELVNPADGSAPVAVRCNEKGTMENGKKHPSVSDEVIPVDSDIVTTAPAFAPPAVLLTEAPEPGA